MSSFVNINVVEGGVLPPPSDSDKLSLLGCNSRMIMCIISRKIETNRIINVHEPNHFV